VAVALPLAFQIFYGESLTPLLRLIIGGLAFTAVYLLMLLYVMGQKAFYLDLVRGMRGQRFAEEKALSLA